uniref:GNAT family N-acetyltransferase n=1 Tax=Thaumasiovibrio occultus TaxID=1891184 RepID=UPI0018653924|nr:GNAT family N-acetyltransferase [Thaumasiovibrio occultus]
MVEVVQADYANPQHGQDIIELMDTYSRDPMGGGAPLDDNVKANLVKELAKIPHAYSILCYVDGKPAALANCFEAFSTFKCKPLINIHDVVVVDTFRGLNLSQKLLAKVEEVALERGCCKITLEVLEGNEIARNCYRKFGFSGYELDPKMGNALFWQKIL